jgi:predicted HTH transcriptional regulator
MLLWQKKGGLKVHFFDDKQDMSKVVFERVVAVESLDNVTNNVTNNVTGNVTGNVDRLDKLINLLDKKPNISTTELAIELSVTKRTILRDIAKLKEIQKIQRIGKEKSGYWIIKKEHE